MSDNQEQITIPHCPICGASHTYGLKVEYSTVLKLLTVDNIKEEPREVRKTRLFTCPVKHEDFQGTVVLYETSSSPIKSVEVVGLEGKSSENRDKENNSVNQRVEVEEVSAVTPHNRALYEAGKALLVESITTGREFCKFMISMSTGAIPIYLGLLKFVLPEKYVLSVKQGIIAIIPAILFLVASVIFVSGYLPQAGRFSLDIPSEIERERTKTIQSRAILTRVGFGIFSIGTLAAIVSTVMILMSGTPNKGV